ncbi:MAG: WecB/TagA/CpsF family glycosyltransferase [Planctomycetota bacterium]
MSTAAPSPPPQRPDDFRALEASFYKYARQFKQEQAELDAARVLGDDEVRLSAPLWSLTQRLVALSALAVLSPLLLVMYLSVRLTSRGPFLFRQKRRGFRGEPFEILKVRTMTLGAEQSTALGVQQTNPAITAVGRVYRALKLDELPQLWNIVRGDMELVGPRPIPMPLEDELMRHIPDFARRQVVKPGLTNIGQICVVDNELDEDLVRDWSLRAEGERHYVLNKSFAYDVVMVFMTVLYVARKALRRSKAVAIEGATPSGLPATSVLGVPIANLTYDDVIEVMEGWIDAGTPSRYVCICPVHSVVEAKRRSDHRQSLLEADINTADGMPVVWAQRLLGHVHASRVYGPTLMEKSLARAEQEGWRIAFYGGHSDRLEILLNKLGARFPNLNVVYAESPPFRALTDEESDGVIARLREARPDVVWVGLGCPKQEAWMASHRERIPGVMLGVGAAFDFHAGVVRQAPAFLQRHGLEWAFRLWCEPRRLFKRYATTNPMYVGLMSIQLLGRYVMRRSFQVRHKGTGAGVWKAGDLDARRAA